MSEQTPPTAAPQPGDSPEMKPCPYCGRMTSARANFCWWCARELAARPERPEARETRPARPLPVWAWGLIALAVLAAIALLVLR